MSNLTPYILHVDELPSTPRLKLMNLCNRKTNGNVKNLSQILDVEPDTLRHRLLAPHSQQQIHTAGTCETIVISLLK